MRVLIIEDEKKLSRTIAEKLKEEGFVCDVADNGVTGEEYALINDYDVIILDIMLPRQDGWTTCKNLRQAKRLTPIIMLTALEDIDDKIRGLNEGADDYLPKPFNLRELVARIRALLRRSSMVKTTSIEMYGIMIDQNTKKVAREGVEISLTAKEFSLLELFLMNPGKVLSRGFISEHLWDMNFDPRSNVIDAYIKFLRQKVDRGFSRPLIHTLRGSGYVFSDEEQ